MAKDLNVTMLLDVYGQLLTDKQRGAIDMYYNEDLSLSEIAAEIGISPQGVRNSIKQGERHLLVFEKQLGIVERFESISKKLRSLGDIVSALDFEGKDRFMDIMTEIAREL